MTINIIFITILKIITSVKKHVSTKISRYFISEAQNTSQKQNRKENKPNLVFLLEPKGNTKRSAGPQVVKCFR